MISQACCTEMLIRVPLPWPFDRLISLGFYDGSTSGLVRCGSCYRAYEYDLVAWDRHQQERIFSLSRIDEKIFESVVQVLGKRESPNWPVWFPNLGKSDAEKVETIKQLDTVLSGKRMSELFVMWEIGKEIRASKGATPAVLSRLPPRNDYPSAEDWEFWHTFLVSKE